MNSVETITGADGQPFDRRPIRTFPEGLEIRVRKIVSNYVESGAATDELVFEILKFYEEGNQG